MFYEVCATEVTRNPPRCQITEFGNTFVLYVTSVTHNPGKTEEADRHNSSQLVTIPHCLQVAVCSLTRAGIQTLKDSAK
jgi:hypothetical protein